MSYQSSIDYRILENLKPVCISLLENPTTENVIKMKECVTKIPTKALQVHQNFILLPIEHQLCSISNTEIQRYLVECITTLISLTHITTVEKLIHLCVLLCQKITAGKRQVTLSTVPEELKLSVVQCIQSVFTRTDAEVLYKFYSRHYYAQLSSLVYTCVLIAKEEQLISLRVAALDCILVLAQVSNTDDPPLRDRVRNVIMLMMPGIVSACVTITKEIELQNHSVSIANLQVWSEITSLVMEDDKATETGNILSAIHKINNLTNTENDETNFKKHLTFSSQKEKIDHIKRLERTEQWISDSAEEMCKCTKEMMRYLNHMHYATRRQLALSCQLILEKCPRNMTPSVSDLVSTLIILSQDEMNQVSEAGQNALQWFAKKCKEDSGKSLFEILEQNFYTLISRMPRIMHERDENSQLSCLSLLEGYLKLQDTKLHQVLSSTTVRDRLVMSLIQTVSLETSGIVITEDCSIPGLETDRAQHSLLEPWKNLKYCNDRKMLKKLENICKAMSSSNDLFLLIETCMEKFDEMPAHAKEIILLLNLLLSSGSKEAMSEVIHNVIDTYLEPKFWNLPTSLAAGVNILQLQSNVIQICLIVEGIGKFALLLGISFSPFLISCLYPVLERAGSRLAIISTAGLEALQNIAEACVKGGITELVQNNVDYLSHHISTKLRRAHDNPSVFPVLTVVMKHSTENVFPSLHEIIRNVLVQTCDVFQEHNAHDYLQVFLIFMISVNRWYRQEKIPSFHENLDTPSAIQKLLEYKQFRYDANNFEDMDENKTAEELYNEDKLTRELQQSEEELSNEEKKELPPHIALTVEILNRSLHFLPSKDDSRQIQVLKILREGIYILKDHEDQLLPVVHKIWPPLVNRFQTCLTKPLIIQHAFRLLCVLASTAKDFIRSRTLKSVVPSICNFLEQNVNQSRLKDSGSGYQHTQLYKLQYILLSELGQLSMNINLQEKDLHKILTAATPYLSSQQPSPLQEKCKSLFKTLSLLNQDLVWLLLSAIWPYNLMSQLSHSEWQTLNFITDNKDSSEFKKNVQDLLENFS